MPRDDPNADRPPRRRSPFGEYQGREEYTEKTVRGVTVGLIQDRYNDHAWIRSTLVVENEP
jgi:predicted adenine nucleotide alpha hydrolase (AANH) superfamily ATPase